MNKSIHPVATTLAQDASNGRLAIYTGAGLSHAAPTNMPDSATVAQHCYERSVNLLGTQFQEDKRSNLVYVADTVAVNSIGHEFIQQAAADIVERTTAEKPNFGHKILALLLLEGFVVVITTNWDTCIEYADDEERVLAVISDQDRREIQTPALLKVHGCATRPTTMLITTQDLSNPLPWARDAVHERLANSKVVFVGIGDVAGYVQQRIKEATEVVEPGEAIYIVSPNISADWKNSQWAKILPDLPEDHRIPESADSFLDYFAAAYIRGALQKISEGLSDAPTTIKGSFNSARIAFEKRTSLEALRWLRCSAYPRSSGVSAIQQKPAFANALVALGSLANGEELRFGSDGKAIVKVVAQEAEYEVLVATKIVTASTFRREAKQRLRKRLDRGAPTGDTVFLIAGALGSFNTADSLPEDVLDEADPTDLVAGSKAVTPKLIHAEGYIA